MIFEISKNWWLFVSYGTVAVLFGIMQLVFSTRLHGLQQFIETGELPGD